MRDTEFYERRIAEERDAGAKATDEGARAAHEQLADLYAERLEAMISREQSARPKLKVAFSQAQA